MPDFSSIIAIVVIKRLFTIRKLKLAGLSRARFHVGTLKLRLVGMSLGSRAFTQEATGMP